MSLEDFTRLKVIGKGSYGEVWLAQHKNDRKKQYVLKKMNLSRASKRERKSAEQEAKLLSKLKHPNIVSYKDSFEGGGYLYIAMQYCEGGDLYNKLKEQKGVALEERQVVEWFIQIAMALQYLHERNILHRDLKTQNIFLTKSKIIKVGDLGIARVLDGSNDMATTLIGTPYYMSPELFSNKAYNHKSDVWALGCCVYEMATLKHAFNAKDMNALVYKILKGKMPLMPKKYSSELLGLIRCMLHQDAEKRPSVNKLLRDPYIKKNIAVFLEDTKKSRRPSSASRSRPGSASSSRSVPSTPVSSTPSPCVAPSQISISTPSSNQPRPSSSSSTSSSQQPRPSSSSSSHSHHRYSSASHASSPDVDALVQKQKHERNKSDVPPDVLKLDPPSLVHNSDERSRRASAPSMNKSPPSEHKSVVNYQDELDSVVKNKNNNEERPGAGEFQRPILSRKSSKSELESSDKVTEKAPAVHRSSLSNSGDCSENTETLKEEDLKPPPSPNKKESTPKKKKFLRNHIKNKNNNGDEDTESISSSRSNKDIFSNPKPVAKHRPLPTPPIRVEEDNRLPRKRGEDYQDKSDRKSTDSSSRSSSISSSKEDGDLEPTPRSLPNLSARERRRQKNPASLSAENPHSARIRLRKPPERHDSDRITRSERDRPVKVVHPVKPVRQPSIDNDSSSSSEELQPTVDTKEQAKRRESKEMNNFISLLNTTLHQEKEGDKSDDEAIEEAETLKPIEEIAEEDEIDDPRSNRGEDEIHHSNNNLNRTEPKSVSMPSIETLADTSRLMQRIQLLHTDCVKGIGFEKLKKAYDILNNIEDDEVEPKLVALLGKDEFDEYAGKIWQLKFCEESLFTAL